MNLDIIFRSRVCPTATSLAPNQMMNRQLSAHMADIKGKRICYDHDDEPIHLTDENDSPTIKDYHDLQSVLRQGPFHYNFCMFVLVRWEPVVHDDYPWIIPFWIEITGIPLHLWTIKNLRNIGGRLGHIDTVELSAGRMLIDVDTRQPLTFTRKIASPGGEEVSIQIHYDKLFKHCSSCGMLTHEVAYCPMKFPVGKDRVERTGVFERLPTVATSREPLLRDQKPYDRYETYSRSDRYGKGSRRSISPQRKHRHDDGFMSDARAGYHRSEVYNESFSRKQGGKENRYSSSFSRRNNRYAPYQKQQAQTWRAKEKMEKRLGMEMINCEPYDHGMNLRQTDSPSPQRSADISMEDRSSRKKIASAIVTPSRQGRDENVTRRDRDTVRLLSFSPKEKAQLDDAQIIGALNDMEIIGTSNMEDVDREDSLMVVDNDDDLLGDELMDMDAEAIKDAPAVGAEGVEATKGKPRASHPSRPSKKESRVPPSGISEAA
ncbi:LOW QUALITY PROTEIN: hypothetical protein HID58_093345 [Brassica napus]|uniref:Zinc knuckle CX2CX4HX4C domain-containing protein n=1 Tax=Brassica napus TaxID=3708 RepID=A0ABQ7XE44_BRANA|nr:LOW QUALITY PROTEIN: hypothetical protein HID58_093345 [Brassica napus]